MTSEEKPVARIRVTGRGSCHIPSHEIARRPEVKEMQQLAARIVGGKHKGSTPPIEIKSITPEESNSLSAKLLTNLPDLMEGEDFSTQE